MQRSEAINRFRPAGPVPRPVAVTRYAHILLAMKLSYAMLVAYAFYRLATVPFSAFAGALVIAGLALAPLYFWASGTLRGMPILPLYTLTFLWTFALPLILGHPEVEIYDADELAVGAAFAAAHIASAIAAWWLIRRRPQMRRRTFLVLPDQKGYAFLMWILFAAILFVLSVVTQTMVLSSGVFSIVRSATIALASVTIFVLAVRVGRGDIVGLRKWLFFAAATSFMLIHVLTIFLVGAIISAATALIGYSIGARRVPWRIGIVVVLIFSVLHGGKGEMRDRYWGDTPMQLGIAQVPAFFAEWAREGTAELTGTRVDEPHQSMVERVGLMHMLLMAQREVDSRLPYLEGATYAIIPGALVPRIFAPDKPTSHEGTRMLNIHFGLQSEEDVERTTIGWGLLCEALANFGLAGVMGVGAIVGLVFGFAERLTEGAPLMSLENLAGIMFASMSIQTEFTAAVMVTALFQSLASLLVLLPLLEKRKVAG